MKQCREEGIVLQSLDYQESSRILSVFTKDAGIISLLAREKTKPKWIQLTTPLCRADFFYQIHRSTLYRLVDGHVLNAHLHVRTSYPHLLAAGAMLRGVLHSQFQGKPAPLLYKLLTHYLTHLPHAAFPAAFHTSFFLKLLKHDGLIALSSSCLRCHKAKSAALKGGESVCAQCADSSAVFFSPKEWDLLHLLQGAQTFSALSHLCPDDKMTGKIEKLFEQFSQKPLRARQK